MNRAQALAILALPREQAVSAIIALGEKAARWEHLQAQGVANPSISPTTPSGMQPVYLKPAPKRRAKTPGRKAGHPGAHRPAPAHLDERIEHTLTHCPHCDSQVGPSIRQHTRYIEEIPPVVLHVSAHTVHGHWCATCQKIVTAPVAAALPHSTLGLRFVVYTAWLHYFVGVSVGNCVKIAHRSLGFSVSPHKLIRKSKASLEIWAKLTGRIDTREKFEANRMRLASDEWARMEASGSRECRNCHSFDAMGADIQKQTVYQKHMTAKAAGQTCIDCHKGIAHHLPKEYRDPDEE